MISPRTGEIRNPELEHQMEKRNVEIGEIQKYNHKSERGR